MSFIQELSHALASQMPKAWYDLYESSQCGVKIVGFLQHGEGVCITRSDALVSLAGEPWYWQWLQERRLLGSEALAHSGADPFLLFRKLIYAERGKSETVAFFRGLGVVHVFTAAGMHLYALRTLIDKLGLLCARVALDRAALWPKVADYMFYGVALMLWALTQFRLAWLRGFTIVLLREWLGRRGVRWPMLRSFILLGMGELFFYCVSVLFSQGSEISNHGSAHFYASVFGGIVGLSIFQGEKSTFYSSLIGKLKLSVGSTVGGALAEISRYGLPLVPSTVSLNIITGYVLIMCVYPVVSALALLGFMPPMITVCGWSSVFIVTTVEWLNRLTPPVWVSRGLGLSILAATILVLLGRLLVTHHQKRKNQSHY